MQFRTDLSEEAGDVLALGWDGWMVTLAIADAIFTFARFVVFPSGYVANSISMGLDGIVSILYGNGSQMMN